MIAGLSIAISSYSTSTPFFLVCTTQQVQSNVAIAFTSVWGMDYNICDIKGSAAIVMIGNLSNKATSIIPQISVISFVLMIHNPKIVPITPFLLWKGDGPTPCMVIGHSFRICHHFLSEPKIFQRRCIKRNETFPFYFCQQIYMLFSCFAHLRNRHILGSPLILEPQLFLHTFRFLIAITVTTPHTSKVQIFKGMLQQFSCSFQNKALSPIWNPQPVAQFCFVILRCEIVMMKTYASDGKSSFPQNDGIGLWNHQYISNHLTAILHTGMYRPPSYWSNMWIFCVFIAFFSIRFFPRTENAPFCF
ncbi:hypothetical protein EVA_10120 [gut metagenome]|uniref:Uncharacterized protein n=1 Tax=gut metagenome TaxID=749906 RepID=J9GII8_9ZZZZ